MLPLFLLFIVLPIAEIMLIINVSGTIGGVNTFIIVVVTAAFGAYFVRQQGFSLIHQIQTKLAKGTAPGTELTEALLLLVAGILLITPGFITDILGFLFTLPFSRAPIAAFLMRKVVLKATFAPNFSQGGFNQASGKDEFGDGETIDGEYTNTSDGNDKNRLN